MALVFNMGEHLLEYKVLVGSNLAEITKVVNEHIKAGYKPQGGIHHELGASWAQAVIKMKSL